VGLTRINDNHEILIRHINHLESRIPGVSTDHLSNILSSIDNKVETLVQRTELLDQEMDEDKTQPHNLDRCTRFSTTTVNPVTGHTVTLLPFCEKERAARGRCGVAAKFHEPRDEEPVQRSTTTPTSSSNKTMKLCETCFYYQTFKPSTAARSR
jgi:hypothetical protein